MNHNHLNRQFRKRISEIFNYFIYSNSIVRQVFTCCFHENTEIRRRTGSMVGVMNGSWDKTNLRIYTSWANSLSILSFKLSCLRTLMATSWLQNVPLYLFQLISNSTFTDPHTNQEEGMIILTNHWKVQMQFYFHILNTQHQFSR